MDISSTVESSEMIKTIRLKAQTNRISVFKTLYEAGTGHWGGSSSSCEILSALYYYIMNIKPDQPDWENRDRLILSKGHAAPMLYTILADLGYFKAEELSTLRKLDSRLQGHPCMLKTPGVDMSTGALGHGISVGLGMALAAKILKKNYWTFVIVGEGCLNEGQSWEGIMSVAKFKPPRLAILIDYNKVQLDGKGDNIMPLDPLPEKLKAFNLNVNIKVFDGHNITGILSSWEWMKDNQDEPVVVIYKTTKGKGISFMEDNHVWHGNQIDDDSYAKGLTELEHQLEILMEEYDRE